MNDFSIKKLANGKNKTRLRYKMFQNRLLPARNVQRVNIVCLVRPRVNHSVQNHYSLVHNVQASEAFTKMISRPQFRCRATGEPYTVIEVKVQSRYTTDVEPTKEHSFLHF